MHEMKMQQRHSCAAENNTDRVFRVLVVEQKLII